MNVLNLINNDLLKSTTTNNLYLNSPFKDIISLPPATKGKRYEQIVDHTMTRMGYDVQPNQTAEYDRVINGKRVEIKGSSLAADKNFKFHQIRLNDDYDQLLLICFWPLDCRMFILEKDDISKSKMVTNDHGGDRWESGMIKLIGNPANCEYCQEVGSLVESPVKGVLV